jgi:membrane protease YdiL (CAAX protease family)
LAFGLCIGFFYVVAQVVVMAIVAVMEGAVTDPEAMEELASNGFVISLSMIASAPFAVGLSGFFAWLRQGLPVLQYLGFIRVSWKVVALGMVSVVLLGFGYDAVSSFLDRPEIPDFMIKAYQTARFPALLWFAVIVLAPLSEEIFFRGFLFKGIESSALGGTGAVLITSFVWAVIHLQYDLFNMVALFFLGLLPAKR